MRRKFKVGQQVRTHMLQYWGMGTVVALGLQVALIGYKTPTGYYEDIVSYILLGDYNKHLLKGNKKHG